MSKDRRVKGCPNEKCVMHLDKKKLDSDNEFCPKCGTEQPEIKEEPAKEVEVLEEDKVEEIRKLAFDTWLYFKDNLRAKTGTLSDSSAIAGYITSRRGKVYAFDIMITDAKTTSADKKNIEEQILRNVYLNN